MNHFDTVKLSIFNRLKPYSGNRSEVDLDAMIGHQMRYHAKLYNGHSSGSTYEFKDVDIEMIYNRILSDLIPR